MHGHTETTMYNVHFFVFLILMYKLSCKTTLYYTIGKVNYHTLHALFCVII